MRRVLGSLWIIDALLKLQPGLAHGGEELYVFEMTAMGAPGAIARTIFHLGNLFERHRQLWWLLAVVELAIGAGLMARRTQRMALGVSIIWALGIWVFGEGFDGVLTGTTSIVTGYPGAAVLYALLGFLLWPMRFGTAGSIAASGPLGKVSFLPWSLLWLGAAVVQIQPEVGPGGFAATLFLSAREQPGLLAGMDRWVVQHLSVEVEMLISIVVAVACVMIAVAYPLFPRVVLSASIALSIVFWVVGENLGGLLSGSATDVGTGPLLVLLASVYWPQGSMTRAPSRSSPSQVPSR